MIVPRVAVLLATYNGAAYFEAQLASILWQRNVDVHVFIRDDGSSDDTRRILLDLATRGPDRITVVDDGISTGSATGNFFTLLKSVDFVGFDYVAFADQDDVWTPDKLRRAIERIVGEGADGYSSDLIAYDMVKNVSWVLQKGGRNADLDYLLQGGSAGCTYVFTPKLAALATNILSAAPPFCPGASHDWILYAICRSHGLSWTRDHCAEILYRQHGGNDYGARRGLAEVLGKLRLTRSKWYREHILWLRNVLALTAEEERVLSAIARGRIADRLWLIWNASRFRRTPRSVAHLRAAIALGVL